MLPLPSSRGAAGRKGGGNQWAVRNTSLSGRQTGDMEGSPRLCTPLWGLELARRILQNPLKHRKIAETWSVPFMSMGCAQINQNILWRWKAWHNTSETYKLTHSTQWMSFFPKVSSSPHCASNLQDNFAINENFRTICLLKAVYFWEEEELEYTRGTHWSNDTSFRHYLESWP